MSDLRLYTFVNGIYLSSIQAGIQSAHLVHELFLKYHEESAIVWDDLAAMQLFDWAQNHKTMIVLSGGACGDLNEKYTLLELISNKLSFPMPFECFHEDEYSLGGILTCVGCVLPEEIYDAVDHRKACLMVDDPRVLADQVDGNCQYDTEAYYFIRDKVLVKKYYTSTAEHDLITMVKSCSLAR